MGLRHAHILWRHHLDDNNGITIDGLYKSGNTDEEQLHSQRRDRGLLRPSNLVLETIVIDAHVNFTGQTMVRIGVGLKF